MIHTMRYYAAGEKFAEPDKHRDRGQQELVHHRPKLGSKRSKYGRPEVNETANYADEKHCRGNGDAQHHESEHEGKADYGSANVNHWTCPHLRASSPRAPLLPS